VRNRRTKRRDDRRVSSGWFCSTALVQNPPRNSSEWTNFYEYNDGNQLTVVRGEQAGTVTIARICEYDSAGRLFQVIVRDKPDGIDTMSGTGESRHHRKWLQTILTSKPSRTTTMVT